MKSPGVELDNFTEHYVINAMWYSPECFPHWARIKSVKEILSKEALDTILCDCTEFKRLNPHWIDNPSGFGQSFLMHRNRLSLRDNTLNVPFGPFHLKLDHEMGKLYVAEETQ